MNDARRRRNLETYFNGPAFNGDRKKFCAATGLTNGRLTQLLDPNEPFGERAAKNLTASLRLPEDHFERDQPVDAGFFARLMDLAMKLDDAERAALVQHAEKLLRRENVGETGAAVILPSVKQSGARPMSSPYTEKNNPGRRASDKKRGK